MNEAIHNGHQIKYFDSMEDIPIDRFVVHNFMLSVDTGIGSDMEAVDRKIDPIFEMLGRGDVDKVREALINMKINLRNVVSKQHPKLMSFAALVHSVDGVEYNDLTESGLTKLVNKMGKIGISWGTVKFIIDQVKKKSRKKPQSTFLI